MIDAVIATDYLAQFDAKSAEISGILRQTGRYINYLRHMVRDIAEYLPADHPWRPGIEEIIAGINPDDQKILDMWELADELVRAMRKRGSTGLQSVFGGYVVRVIPEKDYFGPDRMGCKRSHPHENMDAECARLTEVARRGDP